MAVIRQSLSVSKLGLILGLVYSVRFSFAIQCNPGYYQSAPGASACVECSAGTYSTAFDATGCTACDAGYYSTQTAAQYCTPCMAGAYSGVLGSNSSLNCVPCEAGKFQQCNLIYIDSGNRLLRQVDLETGYTTTWIGNKATPSGTSLDGIGLSAAFISPKSSSQGISRDGSFILVVDGYSIKRVDVHTRQVTTILGSPTISDSVMGIGLDARLTDPQTVVVSSDGKFALIKDSTEILYLNISKMEVSRWISGLYNFCLNDCMAITSNDETLYIFDADSISKIDVKTKAITFLIYTEFWGGILIDPSNSYLLVVDVTYETLKTFNLTTFELRTVKESIATVYTIFRSMTFTPDGNQLIYTTDLTGIYIVSVKDWTSKILISGVSKGYVDGNYINTRFNDNMGVMVQCFTGRSQCSSCPATKNSTKGAVTCYNSTCDPGYYSTTQQGSAASSCVACNPGTYSTAQGATACTKCNAGYYSTQNAAQLCIPCVAGTYSTVVASNSVSNCVRCTPGTYQPCFLNVYDRNNRLIRRVNAETGDTLTWIGNISAPAGVDYDGFGLNSAFITLGSSTKGLSPDGSFILLGDRTTIKKVDLHTRQVSTVVGVSGGYGWTLGSGNQARLMYVTNVVISNDSAFALATNHPQIIYLNISTMTASEWVGGLSGGSVTDGIGTNAVIRDTRQLYTNMDITPDNSWVYFFDYFFIRMIEVKTRSVTTIAGCGVSSVVDGIGRSACLGISTRLLIDPSQSFLLIGDSSFYVLRTMDLKTLEVKTVMGQKGVKGYLDGVGTQATMGFIRAMAFNYDGTKVFIASDTGIRVVIVSQWKITHLTTEDLSKGYADGDYITARFNDVGGINMQCATGQTQCTDCPVGKYSDEASVSCKSQECAYLCPNGFYNSDCASTSPSTCAFCTN